MLNDQSIEKVVRSVRIAVRLRQVDSHHRIDDRVLQDRGRGHRSHVRF